MESHLLEAPRAKPTSETGVSPEGAAYSPGMLKAAGIPGCCLRNRLPRNPLRSSRATLQ